MSEVQLNRVEFYVNEGREAGANILVGGRHIGERGVFFMSARLPAMRRSVSSPRILMPIP